MVPVMNTPPTSAVSALSIDPRSVRGVPANRIDESFPVAFRLGLDLSPLRPRQRVVARALLARLTGYSSMADSVPQT